jgi:hypothetical protein
MKINNGEIEEAKISKMAKSGWRKAGEEVAQGSENWRQKQ